MGKHNQRCEQWAYGRAAVAANLEYRLSEAFLAAGGKLCHTRRLGMEDGRPYAYHRDGSEHGGVAAGKCEPYETGKGEAHAGSECVRAGAPVGVHTHKGLQQ